MALVFIIDRGKGVRATLPATLTCGIAFAVAQFATSNYLSTQLTDIVAALVGALSVVILLRVWQPADTYVETETDEDELVGARRGAAAPRGASGATTARGAAGHHRGPGHHHDEPVPSTTANDLAARDAGKVDSTGEVVKAYAPYLIIIALFIIAQLPGIKGALDAPTRAFAWPGLDGLQTAAGKESELPIFKLNWLSAAGTLMLVAGLLTIPAIGIAPAKALQAYRATYRQLASAILTVMAVLGLAYVMNASGQTATLGSWMAGAGAAFAILSPILGWLGVAVTGSDTSSNSLFGALQVSAAKDVGLSPALMAAANSSGGVLGKMISPAEPRHRRRSGRHVRPRGRPVPQGHRVEPGVPRVHVRHRVPAVDGGAGLDAALTGPA